MLTRGRGIFIGPKYFFLSLTPLKGGGGRLHTLLKLRRGPTDIELFVTLSGMASL